MLDITYQDTWETRKSRLNELGFTNYQEFLNSRFWKETREKAATRNNYSSCEICGDKNVHLHHSSYKWLGTKDELRCINAFCSLHHSMIHKLAKTSGISVRLSTNLFRSKATNKRVLSESKKVNTDVVKIYHEILSR